MYIYIHVHIHVCIYTCIYTCVYIYIITLTSIIHTNESNTVYVGMYFNFNIFVVTKDLNKFYQAEGYV